MIPAPAPAVAHRLAPFGTTIFAEMTRLAIEHDAINLSQGFPDFDGPEWLKDAAQEAMRTGHNQYARSAGVPALTESIARWFEASSGLATDPESEITVTAGCTEALAAAFMGLINPGDEVVLFEPFYDSYRACVAMAGARPRFVTLRPPPDGHTRFTFDKAELRSAVSPATRAILLNTPHNPTGKVFTREELTLIAEIAIERDLVVIADEVYERLTYDDAEHVSIASLPGMRDRTVTLSSLGKTFSMTGWKIGWAIAPPHLTAGVRAAHQFLTFAVATPLQHASAAALDRATDYVPGLRQHYANMRSRLSEALADIGFRVFEPEGTYFIMADHTPFGFPDDVAFCRALTTDRRVAAIPPSAFYADPSNGRALVRFAFCKRAETLDAAIERLAALRSRA